jgi:hypothetical protein
MHPMIAPTPVTLKRRHYRVGSILMAAALLALPTLAGCTSNPLQELPFTVDGGLGSQHGNYAATPSSEVFTDARGDRCPAWNWDRPISATLVLRLRSASCPDSRNPKRMIGVELGAQVVPMAMSGLSGQAAGL